MNECLLHRTNLKIKIVKTVILFMFSNVQASCVYLILNYNDSLNEQVHVTPYRTTNIENKYRYIYIYVCIYIISSNKETNAYNGYCPKLGGGGVLKRRPMLKTFVACEFNYMYLLSTLNCIILNYLCMVYSFKSSVNQISVTEILQP